MPLHFPYHFWYNKCVPAAVLATLAGTTNHMIEDNRPMADTIMPQILELRVAQSLNKSRAYLHRYGCVDCGEGFVAKAGHVQAGKYTCKPCARLRVKKKPFSHGHCRTGVNAGESERSPQYAMWERMTQRCKSNDPKRRKTYKDRGITVCDEWQKFEGFMAWEHFDEIKKGLQIDRIDNDRGYCPENCRLVRPVENLRNRRSTRLSMELARLIRSYHWSGVSQADLGRMFQVSQATIWNIVAFRTWNEIWGVTG